MEQDLDLAQRASAGKHALGSDRAGRADIIGGGPRGRQVDIARKAQRHDRIALVHRPGIERTRRQARAGKLDQRQIALRIIGDDLALIGFVALGRHDADDDIVGIAFRQIDDVRIGDDPVRRDRKPAAVTEAHDLVVDHRDRHDPDDAAPGGRDIVGRGGHGDGGKDGEQREQA